MSQTICNQCVMDISDPEIHFDNTGVCNHCRRYDTFPRNSSDRNHEPIHELIDRIKKRGKSYPYDCLVAISGGTDSSYMLHCLKKFGLRVLAVHYDGGWNSVEAEHNIKVLTERMGLELYTCRVDPDEFRDIQIAYLNAGVVDLDVPTDHALYGSLFKVAVEKKVPFILTGHNVSTEFVMPDAWVTDKLDSRNLLDIYRKHGNGKPIKTFPLQTIWRKFINYNIRRIEMVFVLNYLKYDKEEASAILHSEYGWEPVRVKHGESIWTRFYQCYILPNRHGIDKRKAHFSNLILSGSITRDEAIEELKQPIYKDDFDVDRKVILERYRISEMDFSKYMLQPIRKHSDFKTEKELKKLYKKIRSLAPLKKLLRISTRH